MGLAMAHNILRAGFPLTVWNRTPARCEPLIAAGAEAVADPVGLASCDVVVTMVSDGDAAWSILVESGLLAAMRPDSVALEMSTIGPAAVAALAEEAAKNGVHLVDAPVSGSVTVA